MKRLRRPRLPTEHSAFGVAPGGLGLTPHFARPGREVGSPGARVLLTGLTRCPVSVPRRPTALPGSQRTPSCLCPALRSRPDLGASPRNGAPVLPPIRSQRRLQRYSLFRDSITRLWHSLSTLRAVLTDDDARLASGRWLTLSGWDWLPTEFFRAVSGLRLPCSWVFLARER